MIFIETLLFTEQLTAYLPDDEYRELQSFLIEKPDAGDLIQGTGGLRKLRWGVGNKGKRSGVRIIYYWQMSDDQIYLMTLYAKNEMTDLSAKEKKALKQMVERW
jgi:mRNA-degrading endonuclease RelE of RelBE toxin-antitoxin system